MGLKNNKVKNQKNKSSDKKKIKRIALASLVVIGATGLGVLAATFSSLVDVYNQNTENKINLTSVEGLKNAVSGIQEIIQPLTEPVNILVLGSDIGYSRGHSNDDVPTRSDTIMLAHVDPQKNEVTVLSIPRDTRTLIPEKGYYDKINAAYAYGGEKLARQAVANLTGVPIQHYVALKVNGLINIVDILGGVEVDVEKNMKYRDDTAKLYIDIKKGKQVLDGKSAHHYVRFRHDEIGDIGRVQRQQKFMNAMSQKMLNPTTIIKLPEIVSEVQKNITTDLTSAEMLRIGNFARGLKREQIRMVMLPGRFGNIGGASYWLEDEFAAKEVIKELFPDSAFNTAQVPDPNSSPVSGDPVTQGLDPTLKRKYRISILNGTMQAGLAKKAARLLRDKGWVVWNIGEAKTHPEQTQIIVQTGISKPVPYLSEALEIQPEIVNASIGDIYSDYTIIIGNDFNNYLQKKQESMDIKTKKLQ
ncbi:MAG: LCP family protein, partial [Candidatus Sericytochromatia bacterium]